MTIKPVRVLNADGDKKEAGNVDNVCNNVVVAGHRGQSPVFDELAARHQARRSPHKSSRSKRRDHQRDRNEREKHVNNNSTIPSTVGKCNSPNMSTQTALNAAAGSGSPAHVGSFGNMTSTVNAGKAPGDLSAQSPKIQQNNVAQSAANPLKKVEESFSGYNSGDEHFQSKEAATTADEWQSKDEQFAKCISDRGYILKPVEEDGACLFRAISLQIYGDEDMHDVIRQNTMDYINKNREYFSHFVTEDINSYIKRKRRKDSHGNHIEIQAMSEIYSRPVEVYCYKPTPINIFNSEQVNNEPLRLSYQRGSHYNAIIDPYNATVGVGLGLAGYKPELQTKEAVRLSEQLEIEQTMFEDKLKTTDWEATNEAIEEQIARESYLQWCRENLRKSRAVATSTATSTSAEAAVISDAEASPSKYSAQRCSTITSATNVVPPPSASTASSTSKALTDEAGCNLQPPAATVNSAIPANGNMLLEQNYGLSNKLFKLENLATVSGGADGDLGFDSDDTDMSSTSSLGGGNNSPSTSAARLAKKTKNRNAAGLRGSKKRRRDLTKTAGNFGDAAKETVMPSRKSPKRDSPMLQPQQKQRECTPDMEQQPSTSKQSTTPEKTAENNEKSSLDSHSSSSKQQQTLSKFYQELLEASYATEGISEAEMLQQAIQMSTHDYIEDQKRKYLYP